MITSRLHQGDGQYDDGYNDQGQNDGACDLVLLGFLMFVGHGARMRGFQPQK